jgi:hypothetical protein
MTDPFLIMENRDEWIAAYESDWLAHWQETGITDWNRYKRVRNKHVPAAPPIHLPDSRLLFISSAGGFLKGDQEPFDARNDLGDYTIRLFTTSTPLEQIAFEHDHYDHAAVNADPQVVLPLRHLEAMAAGGLIGELNPTVISFMGYQPDAARVVDITYPAILDAVRRERPDAVLLIPV